jgi:hypothetical protein
MSDNEWTKVGDNFEKRDIVDLKRDNIGTVTQGLYEGKKEHVEQTIQQYTILLWMAKR